MPKGAVLRKGQDCLLILKNLVALCLFVDGGEEARGTTEGEE